MNSEPKYTYYKDKGIGGMNILRVEGDRVWMRTEKDGQWAYLGAGLWVTSFIKDGSWLKLTDKEAFIEIL